MTVPLFTQEEFLAFLKENGCEVKSDTHWNDFDRIIMEKDGTPFPFQCRKRYMFFTVCRICESLDIEPPKDHKDCYEQHKVLMKRKKS